MAVSERDVRHVAALARVALDPSRVPTLVQELNGILAHMDVLQAVDITGVDPAAGMSSGGMPLRADAGPAYPLEYARETFAPVMRDGFFLVPRLASHSGAGASADVADVTDVADANSGPPEDAA